MTIIGLHELQIIDSQIGRLNHDLESWEEKATLDQKVKHLGELEELEIKFNNVLTKDQQDQKRAEDSVAVLTTKIDREEKKLYSGQISNPKELKGIENEIISLKKRRDEEETILLTVIERVEKIAADSSKIKKTLQTVSDEADSLRSRFEELSAEINGQLKDLQAQRIEVLATVSPDTLKLYDKVRKESMGLAVVELDGSTCTGCRMELPASELEQDIGVDQFRRCPHCRRILIKKKN